MADATASPRKPARPMSWVRSLLASQFGDRVTLGQVVVDVVFGVVAPVLLLVLDRVFDPLDEGGVVTGRVYALPMAIGGSLLLAAWLRFGNREHWLQTVTGRHAPIPSHW